MKKLFVLAVLALGGCNLKSHSIPGAPLPFASVNYTVMGATSAEACGTYIFGIDFGHLFVDQQGSSGGGGGGDPLSMILGMLGGGGSPSPRALSTMQWRKCQKPPIFTRPRFRRLLPGSLPLACLSSESVAPRWKHAA